MLKDESSSMLHLNVRDFQPSGQSVWDLPTWNYPLAQGVMPLCAIVGQRLIPVGTAFLISKLGVIATAAHVIQEAFREDRAIQEVFNKGASNKEHTVRNIQLAVLHHRKVNETNTQVNVWPLENVQIAHPTDVAFGFLKFQQSFPYLSFTLSPAVPRIGETVFCVGYCDSKFPDGGIPLQEIADGSFDWQGAFFHRFHVAEGIVRASFIKRFSHGYADGPCFLTDCQIQHGQSGGPVFNSAGNICGINLGGASTFIPNGPNSLASLIYPALATKIKFSLQPNDMFSFTVHQPLINLIENGGILTDGSERLSNISVQGDESLVSPLIHKDDKEFTFNDFQGYQDSHPAIPIIKNGFGNTE